MQVSQLLSNFFKVLNLGIYEAFQRLLFFIVCYHLAFYKNVTIFIKHHFSCLIIFTLFLCLLCASTEVLFEKTLNM